MTVDLAHALPRARAALADRRVGVAAQRRARHGQARRTRARRRSSCRRCSRRRSSTRRSSSIARSRPGTRALRRGARLLPGRRRRSSRRPTAICSRARTRSRRSRGAGHREPQRQHRRRLGPLRAAASQDAGADALELNLYHVAADPRRTAADMETADLELDRGRPCVHRHPARRQAQPVLLGDGQLRRSGGRCRRRRSRAVQSLLPAGSRPRHARCRPPARVEPARGSCACRCAGSRSCDRSSAPTCPWPRHPASTPGADVVKALMVGADVAMMTSALLRHGPEHIADGRSASSEPG